LTGGVLLASSAGRRRKERIVLAGLALLAGVFSGTNAGATVDGIVHANILYEAPQEQDLYCYARVPVYGEIGIPVAIAAQASLAPSWAPLSVSMPGGYTGAKEIDGRYYLNLNAISAGAAIGHTYVNDAITQSGVVEYEVELDLTALAAANGSDKAGRKKTVTQAKLAMLALAKNLKEESATGLYRLRVTFTGLPSQSDLDGEPVYASSAWAYTGASPVLAAYEKELVTKWCAGGGQSALYGKTDAIGGEPAAEHGGCSANPSATGADAALLVLLLLTAALLVRSGRRAS
jgi:hypothetical protein